MGRLVILSGPSCAGKGPLCAALRRLYPELAASLHKVVLYNSRAPRPIERDGVDYHFRTRAEVEALRGREGFLVMDVRGDVQALDVQALRSMLGTGDAFVEGAPRMALELMDCGRRMEVPVLTVFLSPLSREEIVCLRERAGAGALPGTVTDLMRGKLQRRTRRQKGKVPAGDAADIERRASSAYGEMGEAWRFQHVLPNHDGEDSENWDALPCPAGDALRTVRAFADLLSGRVPACAERWERGLVP